MANFPPLRKPVREQRKPSHVVSFYSEIVDRNDSAYTANSPIKRGTLYSTITGADSRVVAAYPNLYFLREQKVQLSDTLVSWLWTTDEEAENSYNAQISYLADAVTNPVYARVSTIRRDAYEAAPTIATGTPLTALIGVKITAGGTGYTAPTATFGVAGTGAEVAFVLSGGTIISAIVTKEGTGFTSGSTITISDATGSGATAVCLVQPVAAILTSQKKIELPDDDPMAHEFVSVARVYEVLPGPWVPFTRYQAFIGPIQGKQRAVLNTGQTAPPPTATLRINYEGRDGSNVVLMEKYESNSDGTGSAGNPAYPIFDTDFEDERGPVQKREQAIVPTGAEAGSLVNVAGVITQISYEPFPEYPGLLKKATETWAETGPVIPAPIGFDEKRGSIESVSQLVPVSSPVQSGTFAVSGGTATETTYQPFNKLQVKKIIETWAIPGPLRLQAPKYDAELGQSTSTIQLVENTGQTGTRIATKDTQYRASSYGVAVREELIDDWSDTMPTRPGYAWDDVRGNVTQVLKNVVLAGGESASLAVAAGTATQISYKPVDQFSATKLTETWALPGPLLRNAERYDEALGKVTGTRQLVENTSQTQSAGAAGQTRYEASPFGGAILWELVESWDTSAFPTRVEDTYENERGAVQSTSQLVVATGGEAGSLAVSAGVATHIEYKPRDQFLLTKVTETWAVPAVPLPSESVNEDGTTTITTKTMSLSSAITEGETLAGGTWTKTSSQAITATISWKIVEARPIPGNAIPSVEPDDDGNVLSRSKTLSQASTITASDSVSAGVWTNVKSEPVSDLVAWKVVTARSIPGTPLAGASASKPRVTPPKFILSESTAVTRTKVAAGTLPDDPTNEGDSSKVTPINAAVSMKETEVLTLTTTDPTEYGIVQGQLETITVTHGSGSAPSIGFLTTDASVVHEGGGVFVKKVGAVASWLPLYGQNVDENTRIRVGIKKQFVPNDPTLSVPNGVKGSFTVTNGVSSVLVESQPYDAQKSASVTSTILAADLPAPYTWTEILQLDLPEELVSLTNYRDDATSSESGTGNNLYSQRENSWSGETIPQYKKRLGPFSASITRTYSIGPATIVATPTVFTLQSGSVAIQGGSLGYTFSSNDTGDVRESNSQSVKFKAVDLKFCISADVSGSDGGSISGGSGSATFITVLPASTPSSMPGTVIKIDVKPLRMGIWLMDVAEYTIP